MRIIENRYGDKQQEYEITCPHCMSKLAYTFDDIVSDRFEGSICIVELVIKKFISMMKFQQPIPYSTQKTFSHMQTVCQ